MKLSSLSALSIAAAAAIALASPFLPAAANSRNYDLVRQTATFNSPFGAVRRDALSDEQKRKLRAYGREKCRERLIGIEVARIHNVSILSDGRVRCFYAS